MKNDAVCAVGIAMGYQSRLFLASGSRVIVLPIAWQLLAFSRDRRASQCLHRNETKRNETKRIESYGMETVKLSSRIKSAVVQRDFIERSLETLGSRFV